MPHKPGRLEPGDRVGILLPSSPVKASYRERGLRAIRALGLVPVEVGDVLAGNGYLARSAADTVGDIQVFLDDPAVRAIWAARGGYGANLLLPRLEALRVGEPKLLIGSSDVSTLLWYFLDRFDTVVVYGPMPYSTLAEGRADAGQLMRVAGEGRGVWKIGGRGVRNGRGEGLITGGCLSNLVSLIGTPYMPRLRDRLVLLEDRGERPYRIDRMVWQLVQSGALRGVRGLILGEFPECFKDEGEREQLLGRLVELTAGEAMPVVFGLPFGHADRVLALPLGVRAELNVSPRDATLSILEPAVV